MTATGYTGGDPSKVDIDGYIKGDVLAANTAGTLTAIPVGANTDVLTADSTDAEGVDWKAGGGGATPSATVVTETTFGQVSASGALVTYSRGDHTHGSPALGADPGEAAIGEAATLSTGVLLGGGLNANLITPSSLDISATIGYIVDYATTPAMPIVTRVSIPAQTVPLNDLVNLVTWWIIASSCA